MIKNPNDIIEDLIGDYLKVFGDGLIGAVLYGSAASHEYSPGKSDINFALLLKDNSISRLRSCVEIQKKWSRKNVSVPLFLTREYIMSSLDTFPVEFLDMRSCYRLLYGEDILSTIEIEKGYLRLQCERELKGVMLHLRTEFIRAGNRAGSLRKLLSFSMRKLIPLFKAILVLKDHKIPSTKSEIISAVEDIFGFGASAFSDVFQSTAGNKDLSALFDRFTVLVDTITGYIDLSSKQSTNGSI